MSLIDELEAAAKNVIKLKMIPSLPNMESRATRFDILRAHDEEQIQAWFRFVEKANADNILKLCAMVRESCKQFETLSNGYFPESGEFFENKDVRKIASETLKKLRGELE